VKKGRGVANGRKRASGGRDATSSSNGEQTLQVVVETPRGSRNKYVFDEKRRAYKLKKILPEGMVFPYDFGFVPGTRADDGDPVDVLILMDEPAFVGCVLDVRLIGVIQGTTREKGKKAVRNDRVIAVAEESRAHAKVKSIADLSGELLEGLEHFFEAYHLDDGKTFEVKGHKGPEAAARALARAPERG
jgi:inorganic pyrophosphatase